MSDMNVKLCSNPNCVRKQRIYLNGDVKCPVCGSDLVPSTMTIYPEMMDTLSEMAEIRSGVSQLLKRKKSPA